MELPTKSKVAQLREEAELKCSKPKKKSNCNPLQQVCLFNVTADPCEFDNLLFKVLCFGKHSKSNYYYMKRFRFSYFSTPMQLHNQIKLQTCSVQRKFHVATNRSIQEPILNTGTILGQIGLIMQVMKNTIKVVKINTPILN